MSNIWTADQLADYQARYAGKKRTPSWARTEAKFQAHVIKFACRMGWTHFHVMDPFRSVAGFPDLCLARPPRLIFAELKTETGEETAEQAKWLELFRRCDVESHLWRPSMIDEIVRILT
jgi:hypothetical protein